MKLITVFILVLMSPIVFAEYITCKTYSPDGSLLSTNQLNLRKDDPADSYMVEVKSGDWKYGLIFSAWREDNSTRHVIEASLFSINDQGQKYYVSSFHQDSRSLEMPLDYSIYIGELNTQQSASAFKIQCE